MTSWQKLTAAGPGLAYSADALVVGPRGTANLRLNAHAIYIVRKLRVAGVQVRYTLAL